MNLNLEASNHIILVASNMLSYPKRFEVKQLNGYLYLNSSILKFYICHQQNVVNLFSVLYIPRKWELIPKDPVY